MPVFTVFWEDRDTDFAALVLSATQPNGVTLLDGANNPDETIRRAIDMTKFEEQPITLMCTSDVALVYALEGRFTPMVLNLRRLGLIYMYGFSNKSAHAVFLEVLSGLPGFTYNHYSASGLIPKGLK